MTTLRGTGEAGDEVSGPKPFTNPYHARLRADPPAEPRCDCSEVMSDGRHTVNCRLIATEAHHRTALPAEPTGEGT